MIKILVAVFNDQNKQPSVTGHSSQFQDQRQEFLDPAVPFGAITEQPSPD